MTLSPEAERLRKSAVSAQEAYDYLTLARIAKEMVELCEGNGDKLGLAWAYYFAGASGYQRNDGANSARAYRRARDLFTEIGNDEGLARSLLGLAAVAIDVNLDVAQARHLYDQALPTVRKMGDKRRLAIVLGNLGEICRMEGDLTRALAYVDESIGLFAEVGDRASVGWQLANAAQYHLQQRDYAAAIASMRAGYAEVQRDPIPRWVAWHYDTWFLIAAALEQWEIAARVLGFVNRYRDDHSAPRNQGILPWFSGPVEQISAHFEGDRLHELFAEGEALDVEGAERLVSGIVAP